MARSYTIAVAVSKASRVILSHSRELVGADSSVQSPFVHSRRSRASTLLADAFEESGGGLVVRVLVHELALEGPGEDGLAETGETSTRFLCGRFGVSCPAG